MPLPVTPRPGPRALFERACGGLRGLLRAACTGLLAAVLLAAWPGAAEASPEYRFRVADNTPSATAGAAVLTDDERAYLKSLPPVRVAFAKPSFRPYEVIGEDGEITGVHAEMLAQLARSFGFRLRPVVFDRYADALDAMARREVDVMLSLGVTTERARFMEFTLGATPMVSSMFARRGTPPADASRARLAAVERNIATEFIRRRFPAAELVETPDADAALRALAEGRADYYVANLLPTLDRVEQLRLADIEVNRLVQYGSGYYHFAVRKDWTPLARILNKGLTALRQEPPRELRAAYEGLPSHVQRPVAPAPLKPAFQQVLIERPVWRLGAVKGLTLLNDIGADGRHTGIGAEYAEAVARHLGVGLQVLPFDSVASMLDALRAGEIDVVPFLTHTEARARDFGFSRPYVSMPYMIVARSDAPLYWDLRSLHGKRLALAFQHPLREYLAKAHPEIRIVDVTGGQGAMDAVERGDADAAVEVKFFANIRIQSDPSAQLRTLGSVDELSADFHFATTAQARNLLPLVDDALAAIPPDESERLLRRWIAQDLAPAFPWRRYLPLIAVVGTALALVAGLTLWWMRRLALEVQQRRRFERMLDEVAKAVPGVVYRHAHGPDGRLQQSWVSPSLRTLLGLELMPGCTLVQSLAPHVPEDQRAELLDRERACLKNGESFEATCQFQPPGRPARWLHWQATRTPWADKGQAWTGCVIDVSNERELQRRLAREAQARNLLLATASHELRAPTHSLWLALQSVDSGTLPQAAAAALRIARRAAQSLIQLLNDVLDATRLDHGPLRLQPVTFALHDLLDRLAETWSTVARSQGLRFQLELSPELPRTLTHDPLRLEQILTNLLSNACKYTREGSVTLRVTHTPDELEFCVIDTGPGLDAQAQSRLFEPFVTLDEPLPRSTIAGSSGLGLLVTRRIAQLMGGRVSVDSAPGAGSRFTLHLPLRSVAEAADDARQAHEAQTGDSRPRAPGEPPRPAAARVVVCDDDPVSRMLTGQILRLRGYDAVEVGDGASALAAWRDSEVACVVTDLDMPGMPGHELIRQLRHSQAQLGRARVPVIVCTGSPPPSDGDGTPAMDCDAFLQKPLNIETLIAALHQLGVVAGSALSEPLSPGTPSAPPRRH